MEPSGSFDGIFKDAVYRFQNSASANWRRFLLLLSTRIIVSRLEPLTAGGNLKVLIVDDTLFLRDRSKHVELLARVHDHNTGRYHKGFRMLTMGWSDGSSFVPILLSLLSSANEKSRLVPMRDDLDKRTNGYKRRQESVRKSTDILVDLVSTGAVCPYQGPVSSFRQLVCLSRYNSKNTCTGDAHRLHAQRHAENQLHLWRETSHFEGVVQTGSQTSRRANVLATCLVRYRI